MLPLLIIVLGIVRLLAAGGGQRHGRPNARALTPARRQLLRAVEPELDSMRWI
jgi:hypothetical protein